MEQRDLRLIDGQRRDVELARKNQRPQFHAHRERFRRAKTGSLLKAGSSATVTSLADAPPENRESLRSPIFHFASQSGGEAFLEHRPELIGVDEEGQRERGQDDHGQDDADDAQEFHASSVLKVEGEALALDYAVRRASSSAATRPKRRSRRRNSATACARSSPVNAGHIRGVNTISA